MSSEAIPILLTSSIIAHDLGVKLKDEATRLHHTIESIAHWTKISPHSPIVFCDGSNYDLRPIVNKEFPKSTIECLKFENDQQLVRLHGRGYGEGEIVRYALEHSQLIREADCFAKCTSKLWVKNFVECMHWWNGDLLCHGIFQSVFSPIQATNFKHIDTRFYIVNKSFYRQFFLFAHHNINTSIGYGLEECFHKIFQTEGITRALFSVPPVIEGVGGGTASYYRNSIKRVLKERLQIAILRQRKEFSHLFADRIRVITSRSGTN